MKSDQLPPVTVNPAAQAKVFRAYGDECHFHITAEESGGKCTVFTDITPPGGGPPPHFHETEDEWFVILEGQVSYFDGSKWSEPQGPGSSAFAPRGSVHAFKNVGETPLKQLITTSPAGFEKFFEASQNEFARAGGPDIKRIFEIAAEFGIIFVE